MYRLGEEVRIRPGRKQQIPSGCLRKILCLDRQAWSGVSRHNGRLQIFREKIMFILRLRAERGIDGIKSIRWLLKKAKRLGLKAISVIEQKEEDGILYQEAKPENKSNSERQNQ
jgi:hypothetical protein